MAGQDRSTGLPCQRVQPYAQYENHPDKCTLCLACVSPLVSTGALAIIDRPEVQFTENACVQCGVSKALARNRHSFLKPGWIVETMRDPESIAWRRSFRNRCVSCGIPWLASTFNRIALEKALENKHWYGTQQDNVSKSVKQMHDNGYCRG